MQKFYSVPFMGFNIINHSKMVIAPWGAYGYLRVEHFLHQIFAPSYFFLFARLQRVTIVGCCENLDHKICHTYQALR